jgi:ubiquinone/menaquinone biosynthesis C-methylase UbiE
MSATVRQPAISSGVFEEPIWGVALVCPRCGGHFDHIAQAASASEYWGRCSGCFFVLRTENGIWKTLPSDREAYLQRFIEEYQVVRAAEGRGSEHAEYYLALPYRDVSGRNESQWAIRARTFQYINDKLLPVMESSHPLGMKVLDLGSGNAWLSYRLALRGHQPVAVDLLTNDQDGLGAAKCYREHIPKLFPRFQAELDHLPFVGRQFDLAIFNASLHYSEDYEQTLREAIRCLLPGGKVIVADTAWYSGEQSGRQMLAERRQAFVSQYGFASDGMKSLEYLTDQRLRPLEKRLGLRWQIHSPFYGLRWAMRPFVAKFRGRREPSRFRIYVAEITK